MDRGSELQNEIQHQAANTLTKILKDLDCASWRRRQLMEPGKLSTYSWYRPSKFWSTQPHDTAVAKF